VISYVRGEFSKCVKDFIIINERICCLRLKSKWFSCTLINLHAPINKKTEELKEELYNLLEQNVNQTVNYYTKIILGDSNSKVGKEDKHKSIIGNEGLQNETNNNGIKMIQFAIAKGFNVRSATFPHKDIHKETHFGEYNFGKN
jgi:hypothetical protein